MTNQEYRALPRISNSDLSALERRLMGMKNEKLPQNAFDFGTAIHEAILEPNLNSEKFENVDYQMVDRLVSKALDDPMLRNILPSAKTEEVVLWERFGLPLKSKLDIILYNGDEIWDLKTTSCSGINAFESSCVKYAYYRQAAFYLDSIGASKFVFVALSKTAKKDPIFRLEVTDKQIQDGRKQYEKMLKYWARESLKLPNS